MNNLIRLFATISLAAGFSGSALADEVGDLTTFTAGTPARASEVNGNFSQVSAAVNDNHQRATELEARVAELQTQLDGALALYEELLMNQPTLVNSLHGPHDFSAGNSVEINLPGISAEEFNASTFQVQLIRPSGNRYLIPGPGLDGHSEYRFFTEMLTGDVVRITIIRSSGLGELYEGILVSRTAPATPPTEPASSE